MDLQKYINESARTEKELESLVVFGERNAIIKLLFDRATQTAAAIDEMKKSVIYGKYMDMDEFKTKHNIGDRHIGKKEQVTLPTDKARLLHHLMGIVGEAGELTEQVMGYIMDDKPLDVKNVIEEMGDFHWYFAGLHRVLNIPAGAMLQTNYDKLVARYPDKYNDADAINRDYAKEGVAMDNSNVTKFNDPTTDSKHYSFWLHLKNGGLLYRDDKLNNVHEVISLADLAGDATEIQRYGYCTLGFHS
jgi:NTP pyrophosphatase (non-canonical NTP hydrolase)